MGRADEAIAALAAKAFACSPIARRRTAASRARIGSARARWTRRIAEFEQTLRLNPAAGYTHLQLAMLYTLRGDYEAAEQRRPAMRSGCRIRRCPARPG